MCRVDDRRSSLLMHFAKTHLHGPQSWEPSLSAINILVKLYKVLAQKSQGFVF